MHIKCAFQNRIFSLQVAKMLTGGQLQLLCLQRIHQKGRVKRIWYLSPMRAAKVQASLRIRAVSPEPSLLAHTSTESRGTFRQKTRSLAPLNGWACAVEICHDGMLEDTNSLDGAQNAAVVFSDGCAVSSIIPSSTDKSYINDQTIKG